jgi:hypothetical protein
MVVALSLLSVPLEYVPVLVLLPHRDLQEEVV